jgi:hypothetical protein
MKSKNRPVNKWKSCLLAFAVLPILHALAPTVANAQSHDESIAVAPFLLDGLSDEESKIVHESVQRGFGASGRTVLSPQEIASRLGTSTGELDLCISQECVSRMISKSHAAYWARVQISRKGDAFKLGLTLYGASGEKVEHAVAQCELPDCSLGSMVRLNAKELVRNAVLGVPRPTMQPTAQAPIAAPGVVSPTVQSDPSALRAWAWGGVTAGAFATLGGAIALAMDGNDADCRSTTAGSRCFELRDTKILGWALVGTGALLASGSALVLWKNPALAEVKVGVGPSSVLISGRF